MGEKPGVAEPACKRVDRIGDVRADPIGPPFESSSNDILFSLGEISKHHVRFRGLVRPEGHVHDGVLPLSAGGCRGRTRLVAVPDQRAAPRVADQPGGSTRTYKDSAPSVGRGLNHTGYGTTGDLVTVSVK